MNVVDVDQTLKAHHPPKVPLPPLSPGSCSALRLKNRLTYPECRSYLPYCVARRAGAANGKIP